MPLFGDYYWAAMTTLGQASFMLIVIVVVGYIFLKGSEKYRLKKRREYFENSHAAKIEADLKKKAEAAKGVNYLKQRIFEDQVIQTDVMDIIVHDGYEDEFGEMVNRVKDEYTQRQARAFLSCALNLMAHSYQDLEEVRKIAHEMIDTEMDY